jgi:hypothetical protein
VLLLEDEAASQSAELRRVAEGQQFTERLLIERGAGAQERGAGA